MKILYVTNLYNMKNSSAAIRNNALVKGLLELGHEVDVITVRPNPELVSDTLNFGNVRIYDLFNYSRTSNAKKAIKSTKLKNFISTILRIYRTQVIFPDSFVGWIQMVNPEEFKGYDLMISSSDYKVSHFVAAKIKREYPELRWIQIWGDPWAEDISEGVIKKIKIRRSERKLLEAANEVIYISSPTCEAMKNKYPSFAGKIKYVPRSYFEAHSYSVPVEEVLHIVYTGAIRSRFGRTLDGISAAVDKYNEEEHKHKLIVDVYGSVDKDVEEKITSPNVILHGCVDVSELKNIYQKANAMLYLSNKSESTQIPGKLYDYLGTSSLVLCLVNNTTDAIASFLSSIGEQCMLVVNDEKSISEALPIIIEKMTKTYGPNKKFAPVGIAEQVIETIEN